MQQPKANRATLSFIAAALFFLGGAAELVAHTPRLGGWLFSVGVIWTLIGANFSRQSRRS